MFTHKIKSITRIWNHVCLLQGRLSALCLIDLESEYLFLKVVVFHNLTYRCLYSANNHRHISIIIYEAIWSHFSK